MSVPFGFVPGTLVQTPSGPRPIESLRVGDEVTGWDPTLGAAMTTKVIDVHTWTVDHVVGIDTDAGVVRGTAPGTNVWDAFEEAFRAAASLSTLSELLLWTAEGVVAAPVLEVPEHAVHQVLLRHLELDRPDATYFGDGMLVRHREVL